jgi:hypothetical protein
MEIRRPRAQQSQVGPMKVQWQAQVYTGSGKLGRIPLASTVPAGAAGAAVSKRLHLERVEVDLQLRHWGSPAWVRMEAPVRGDMLRPVGAVKIREARIGRSLARLTDYGACAMGSRPGGFQGDGRG